VALAGLRTVWLIVRLAVVIFAAPLGTAVPLGVTAIVFDAPPMGSTRAATPFRHVSRPPESLCHVALRLVNEAPAQRLADPSAFGLVFVALLGGTDTFLVWLGVGAPVKTAPLFAFTGRLHLPRRARPGHGDSRSSSTPSPWTRPAP
jgi:hypothetical protein